MGKISTATKQQTPHTCLSRRTAAERRHREGSLPAAKDQVVNEHEGGGRKESSAAFASLRSLELPSEQAGTRTAPTTSRRPKSSRILKASFQN